MSEPLLRLDRVTMRFGGLKAVAELDLAVESGELVGLIGPNGAGKTTVFNVITGVYQPTHGSIQFEGRRIDGLKPHAIAKRGITRTFQNIRLFATRCCRDNVAIAAHQHTRATLLDALLRTDRFARDERDMQRQADELLEILGLAAFADLHAAELPYGQQRPARDRARAGGQAAAPAAGRAGRRSQPAGDRPAHAPDRVGAQSLPAHHPADRARHACRDGHLSAASRCSITA